MPPPNRQHNETNCKPKNDPKNMFTEDVELHMAHAKLCSWVCAGLLAEMLAENSEKKSAENVAKNSAEVFGRNLLGLICLFSMSKMAATPNEYAHFLVPNFGRIFWRTPWNFWPQFLARPRFVMDLWRIPWGRTLQDKNSKMKTACPSNHLTPNKWWKKSTFWFVIILGGMLYWLSGNEIYEV